MNVEQLLVLNALKRNKKNVQLLLKMNVQNLIVTQEALIQNAMEAQTANQEVQIPGVTEVALQEAQIQDVLREGVNHMLGAQIQGAMVHAIVEAQIQGANLETMVILTSMELQKHHLSQAMAILVVVPLILHRDPMVMMAMEITM